MFINPNGGFMKTFLKYFLVLGLFTSCHAMVFKQAKVATQPTRWAKFKSFCNTPNVKRVALAAGLAGVAALAWVINNKMNPGFVSQAMPNVVPNVAANIQPEGSLEQAFEKLYKEAASGRRTYFSKSEAQIWTAFQKSLHERGSCLEAWRAQTAAPLVRTLISASLALLGAGTGYAFNRHLAAPGLVFGSFTGTALFMKLSDYLHCS